MECDRFWECDRCLSAISFVDGVEGDRFCWWGWVRSVLSVGWRAIVFVGGVMGDRFSWMGWRAIGFLGLKGDRFFGLEVGSVLWMGLGAIGFGSAIGFVGGVGCDRLSVELK